MVAKLTAFAVHSFGTILAEVFSQIKVFLLISAQVDDSVDGELLQFILYENVIWR